MFTPGTNINVFSVNPKFCMVTFFATESIRLDSLKQVIVTFIDIGKALIKFDFGFGVVLCYGECFHMASF